MEMCSVSNEMSSSFVADAKRWFFLPLILQAIIFLYFYFYFYLPLLLSLGLLWLLRVQHV